MNRIIQKIKELLNKRYPQNFLISKPFAGALVFLIFVFLFTVLYRPAHLNSSRFLSFNTTMLLYSVVLSFFLLILTLLLKHTSCFSRNKEWVVKKELRSILILLFSLGTYAYFVGFIIEGPAPSPRWNLNTYFDSLFSTALMVILPILLFSLVNIRYMLTRETVQNFTHKDSEQNEKRNEQLIQIISKAKKEELSFYPSQFIYAESDGNYVVFHFTDKEKLRKVVIRNSISEIEQQLAVIPYFIRIHRAFIVNLNKVVTKSGNSLGYRLKLNGTDDIVPVSRQNTQNFDEKIRQFS